jgi:hypothetical protein
MLVATVANTGGGTSATGVTYNGIALTPIANVFNTLTRTQLWELVAPATGSNNIIVSFNFSVPVCSGAVTYTNVSQSAPKGTVVTNSNSSGEPTVTCSSATGELVVDAVGANTATLVVGASQTQRVNKAHTGANVGMSEEAGAASVIMSWTGNSADWESVCVPVKPFVASTNTSKRTLRKIGR